MSSEKPTTLRDINRAGDTNDTPPNKSQDRNAPKTPPKCDGKENVQLPDCDPAPTPSPIQSSRTYDRWCRPRSENEYLFLLAVKEKGGEPALWRAIQDLDSDAAAFEAAVTFAMSGPHARPDEASSHKDVHADATNAWSKTSLCSAQLAGGYGDISALADIEATPDDEAPAAGSRAPGLHGSSPGTELVAVENLVSAVDSGDATSLADDDVAADGGRIELYESQQGHNPSYLLYAPEVRSPATTREWHAAVLREVARRIKEQPHDEEEVVRRDEWIESVWIPSNRDARERAAQQALQAEHEHKDTTDGASDGDVFLAPSLDRKRSADVEECKDAERDTGVASYGVHVAKRRRVRPETAAGTPARRARSEAASSTGAAQQEVSDHTATSANNEGTDGACAELLADERDEDGEGEDLVDEWRGLIQFGAKAEH